MKNIYLLSSLILTLITTSCKNQNNEIINGTIYVKLIELGSLYKTSDEKINTLKNEVEKFDLSDSNESEKYYYNYYKLIFKENLVDIPVLNYTGTNQRTQKGGDNKNYILDAVSFNKYMIDKFGETPHKLEGAEANNPTEIAELLNGKNGIYVIINSSQNQAGYSGHVDAIINGQCIGGAYTGVTGGVKSIRVWELN